MSDSAAREETIFNIARQLKHPQDRAAYLDKECAEDKELRGRVERLLQAELRADKFFPPPDAGADRKTPEPVPGGMLGDYEIIEKIGGNMGLVFKARHRLLDKVVALKLLPPEHSIDPSRLARFRRELQIMAKLEHPNLVAATDARVVDCWHMVAMEWIDGMDLQQVIETQGPLPVAPACEAIRQAALGLQCAHEQGLIHRDIKPSNLMVTQSGVIKVIDMGLALVRDASTVPVTEPGMVLGTMRYCAPEQYQDASRVDSRADIYSLGCTMYHLLTGKPPYSQRTTLPEVIQAHLHEPFPKLREGRPDAPEELQTALERMTAKDPKQRLPTAGGVAKAVKRFARGADTRQLLDIPSPEARSAQNGPAVGVVVPPAPPTKGSRRGSSPSPQAGRAAAGGRQPSKARWLRRAALLVLLLAIAGALFLALNQGQRQPGVKSTVPVVVLMDTTAPDGTYDEDNKKIGASNARELSIALAAEGVAVRSRPEPLYAGWVGEAEIIALNPDLVIIHRSSFHHSYNAVFNFGRITNGFAQPPADPMWRFLYDRVGDDRLITLLGCIGNEVPHTRFLVYSRGTDTNWLSDDFQRRWVRNVEKRFPKLKDRVSTMVIPNGSNGSFRQTDTRGLLRTNVNRILGLPDRRKPAGNESIQARQNP